MACDTIGQIKPIERAVKLSRKYNTTTSRYFVYVLVGDIGDALERVEFLRDLNVDPFAQAYRDFNGGKISHKQMAFCRWVNHKAIFKSVTWENYKQ